MVENDELIFIVMNKLIISIRNVVVFLLLIVLCKFFINFVMLLVEFIMLV